ncbi:MAG: DUF3303 domain-containing protein [Candidatus Nanopelagicales bacterium]
MKYLVQWSFPQATFRLAAQRFLKTGGIPPAGVTMVGRWHGMNGTGCAVVESSDTQALFSYIAEWMEVIQIEATPLVDDAEAAEALAPLYQ